MLLAFTIVVIPFPKGALLAILIALALASFGLWLQTPAPPETLLQRTLEAAWFACVPTLVLSVPLVWALETHLDAVARIRRNLELATLVPLDLSLVGTIYAVCFLAILGWRARRRPDAPTLTTAR